MNRPAGRSRGPGDVTRHRVFFALWPDATLCGQIADTFDHLIPELDGKRQGPDQWHVTLLFVGGVDSRQIPELEVAARAAPGTVCELTFDRVEYWRKPRVTCLTATMTPPPLEALVQNLQRQLMLKGIAFDNRPLRPHLTLARKVNRPPNVSAGAPLVWPARELVLVESRSDPDGSRYTPLARFRFDG